MLKRFLDITGRASLGILILSPLMLLIALLVRLKLGSPVLIRQEGPGLRGEPLQMLKFRTMTDGHNEDGSLKSYSERLTPYG